MNRYINILLGTLFFLLAISARSFAEDITITTYYPAPFGSYNTLQVFPNSAPPITCDDQHVGFMYFRQDPDPSLSELLVCKGAAQGWKTVASGGASAYWTNTATTVHLVDSNNNVAIGDTDSQGKKLRLRVSTGNTSGETITTESYIHGHPTADASTAIYKSFLGYNWRDPTDSAQTIGELTGVNGFVDINGPGTSTNNIGLLGGVRINSGVAATATYASGVAGQILASGGTFGSAAAIRALSPQTGGTINNLYGVYIDNQDVIGTNRYALYYNGASPVVVTADSKVGIGTNTPGAKLHVVGDGVLIDPPNFSGLSQGGLIAMRRYDGAKTWTISHGGGLYGSDLLFITSHGSTYPYVMRLGMSPVELEIYGNVTLKNLPSAPAMKMIIEGSVGIGRDPATYRLEIAGDAGKTVGGNVWQTLSDSRIKTDIQELKNPIEVINKLHPVKFRYSRDFRRKNNLSENKYYYNFVAQEFQKVFPESVRPDAEGYLYLDTSSVSPYLVAAVQVMDSFIKNQQQEIDGLKSEITKLQAKIK